MEIYSIGFTQKTAEQFFGLLTGAGVRRLVDVRLNNVSQLAGFAKRDDLRYFLRVICGIEYVHEPLLAPTQEMLGAYRKNGISWTEYEDRYRELIRSRAVETALHRESFLGASVLLCSEATAERCHRRVALEYLREHWHEIEIIHL